MFRCKACGEPEGLGEGCEACDRDARAAAADCERKAGSRTVPGGPCDYCDGFGVAPSHAPSCPRCGR